jgi:hypothetical protein
MKKLATFALVCLALLALSAPAFAQPENGDLGVFFDTATLSTARAAAAFAPFNVYIACYGTGDLSGWESSVTISDPLFTNLGVTLNPSNALNVGTVGNFIVGLGVCATAPELYVLATYNLGWFQPTPIPNDALICTGGTVPSSFDGVPGYASCASQLIPFGTAQNGGTAYPDGCGVINPLSDHPVATESVSFGAVKAGF